MEQLLHRTADKNTWLLLVTHNHLKKLLAGTTTKCYYKKLPNPHNLPLYHLLKCLFLLHHALFVWKDKTKYEKRCHKGRMRQTMVSWLVELSRLGRFTGDEPGFEAIRGREP